MELIENHSVVFLVDSKNLKVIKQFDYLFYVHLVQATTTKADDPIKMDWQFNSMVLLTHGNSVNK